MGDRYALVTVAANQRGSLEWQIRQQNYVKNTLPVLSVSGSSDSSREADRTFVLPNEIIVSFDASLSQSQVQVLLNRYSLETIRPLRFSHNRYLVRSRSESGTAILTVANRLNQVAGIQSATLNFVQALAYNIEGQDNRLITPNANTRLQQTLAGLPQVAAVFQSTLLPLAWHLNSTPQRSRFQPRTDIHATEAWAVSNGGEGSVVAVIDSLIQWDHPDLANSLYTVNRNDRFPGETHG